MVIISPSTTRTISSSTSATSQSAKHNDEDNSGIVKGPVEKEYHSDSDTDGSDQDVFDRKEVLHSKDPAVNQHQVVEGISVR